MTQLKNVSIRQRLILIPVLFLVGLAILQVSNFYLENKIRKDVVLPNFAAQVLSGNQQVLKATVESETIALGERLKSLKTHDEQVAAVIAETDPVRFFDDRSGYFFTYSLDGIRINVPTSKAQNGQNLIATLDAKGFAYVAEFVKVAKAGGGFVSYQFEKPGKGVQPKLSYVMLIPGTDILIGTGVYIDNVQEETATLGAKIETKIREYTWVTIGVFAVILVIALGTVMWLGRSMSKSINTLTEEMLSSSDQVAAAAAQVSGASQSLAEGASEQAASLEETSSSLEEMSAMTKENADHMRSVNQLGKETRLAAEKGATDMQAMSDAVDEIKKSSNEIAKIIKTIDEIAFQTNILALNAAVEAARAGEAGMGFAVVADEVRNLAQRSAMAAKDTAAKIETAVSKAAQGVQISETVARGLQEILEKARQVDELAERVAEASKAQSQGIDQINSAVSQMDSVTQSTAASAEESASASAELSAQAENLKESVVAMAKLVDGKFGTQVQRPTPPQPNKKAKTEVSVGEPSKKVKSPAPAIPAAKELRLPPTPQ